MQGEANGWAVPLVEGEQKKIPSSWNAISSSSNLIEYNTPYTVAITRLEGNIHLLINGEIVASGEFLEDIIIDNDSDAYLGGWENGSGGFGSYYYKGFLNNYLIFW